MDLAAQTARPITTIGVPAGLIGRTAGRYLLARLKGEFTPEKTLIETSLVVCVSSGPRRAQG